VKVLQAHLDLLVLLEDEDHQDLPVKSDNLVSPDPLAHLDLLEKKETWERSEDLVQLDVMVFKDPLVCPDLPVTLDPEEKMETRENVVHRDPVDSRDQRETTVPLVLPENKVPLVNLDLQVTMENLVLVVSKVWSEKRETKEQEVSLDHQDLEVYRVFLDNLDLRVTPATVDLWDPLDKLDPGVLLDHKELMVHKVLLVELVNLVWLDPKVNKDKSDLLDLPEFLVSKDLKEKTARKVNAVFKDLKVLLESEEQSEKTDPRVTLDLSVSLVTPVLLDPLVFLVTTETLVMTEILETKVKLVLQVQWENKVLQDPPEREELMDHQDLSDVKEKREPRENPVSVEPPVVTDLSEPLVKLESKVLLDYKGYQDLLVSLVFQVALVLMVLLDLWVPKVLKVSRETLVQLVKRVILV